MLPRYSPALVIAIGLPFLARVCGSAAAQPAPAPVAAAPNAAARVDLPAFRPGMWEYTRTTQVAGARGKPANATVRKCSDPNKEIRDKLAQMKEKGCQFTPMSREGSRYRSTFICPVKGGSLTMSEVITVKGDSSYQDANESRFGKQVTHTTIVATRVGECPPTGAPPPGR
jgi:Protein of unknown function (DUF3617)